MPQHYRYTIKDSSGYRPSSVTADAYHAAPFGAEYREYLPLQSTISCNFYPNFIEYPNLITLWDNDNERARLQSLKTALMRYAKLSPYFKDINFMTKSLTLISVPAIFFGSGIERGSVELSIYADGSLISQISDSGQRGELRETLKNGKIAENTVCGVVLYSEGFIVLFENTALTIYKEKFLNSNVSNEEDNIRWSNFSSINTTKTAYDIKFKGINKIPQLTLLAYAPKGQLNLSNNPTFIKFEDNNNKKDVIQDNKFIENPSKEIKNITKTNFASPEPVMQKETYINGIVIYDKNKKAIAIAKLAKPVRKTEDREFMFKLKLDI
jgi:hypothetical protein